MAALPAITPSSQRLRAATVQAGQACPEASTISRILWTGRRPARERRSASQPAR